MLSLSNISKQYADKMLFEKLNLEIYDGERVGIVGANGSGKTTLVGIINGTIVPDTGTVRSDATNIGFLKQATEYTTKDFEEIFEDTNFVSSFFEISKRLKLDKNIDYSETRLKNLSGGERTKLMLAHILSKNPDCLILDEPTNHLDIEGVDWLIETLNSYPGTLIVVSHDRYFLNSTVFKIIELENGKVNEYFGSYDEYMEQKQAAYEEQLQKYEEQRAFEKKIDKQVRQLSAWSGKGEAESRRQGGMMSDSRIKGAQTRAQVSANKLASQAKAKIARLEQAKQNFVERPYEEGEVHYRLEASPIGSKVLFHAENLSKAFGNNVLFQNATFDICAGEKVALKGKNGCGKTTLVRMLLGEDQDYLGTIWKAPALKWAYLSQDVFDLNSDMTVMQIASQGNKDYKTLFLSNLRNMNMSRQVFDRKVKTLSLGERMRIKMNEVILSDFNLLILDEPTNHLDLPNKLFLEKILKDYKGALILVSHDRTLCENVCDSEIKFEAGSLQKKR